MPSLKILIIGNGGTGKSTLANKLGSRLGIPVTHLDLLSWNDGFKPVPEENFKLELNERFAHKRMIIEGWAFQSTMHDRLLWADVIIYLKYPLDYCLNSVFNRNKEFNNKSYSYDPFTGDRKAHNDLYRTAVERVHYDYEPIVQNWLLTPVIKDKPLYIFTSIEQLNEQYDALEMILKQMLYK
ncbi:MAG: hypothetical protein HYZ54_05995 [Ignavibacteriae bacterium]|nr:hypothetical protein [Ignavibacteriota bacterium]